MKKSEGGGGGGGGGGTFFCPSYFFFGLPIIHGFFSRFKSLYGFSFGIYMLSLFYIAAFYRRVMKCCFLGIKNLQVWAVKGGTGSADPHNVSAKSVDAAIERSALRLQLCFESVIRTMFLPKSESTTFIGSADPLKLLLKPAIRAEIFTQIRRSADPSTLPRI